jgi:signal transduction histidine kinase
MVKLVASRKAAIRLMWIIGVLMLPIGILGFFLVSHIQEDISFNHQEQLGIQLVMAISPVMLDAAEGKLESENYNFLRTHGAQLAEAANLRGPFEPLNRAINAPTFDPALVFNLANTFIGRAGVSSNIILDANPETYYLGVASVQALPRLVLQFKKLQSISETSLKNFNAESLARVASADGELREATHFLAQNIGDAKNVGRSSFEYIPPLADLDAIDKLNRYRSATIISGFTSTHDGTMDMLAALTASSDKMFSAHRELWQKINLRFSKLKDEQTNDINKEMSLVILTSLAAVLLGIGSAITMFHSTLKRLDDITQAKHDAEFAQKSAEDMSSKLLLINDDMVVVNKELAHQMHMLKEAQDALVSKGRMEQLGQLTATIAHELRNPLGAVRTSAFLIERKIKGKELGFETQLARINNGVSRCDDIITQLLDFSRTKPLASRPADLDHWLAKTLEDEARQLPTSVTIECDLNLQGSNVPFDPARLQRAIINLISNAVEAMVGKGEDPTKLGAVSPVLKIKTEIVADEVLISVTDNGPGISPENMLRIRDPLFTTKSFGTGLGLPAVEQIAKQHHGRLEVASTLGEGASFTLYLPHQLAKENAA